MCRKPMPALDSKDKECQPVRFMTYDDESHWSVLTQMYGSVWPRVLPFCIINLGLTLVTDYLKRGLDIDITLPHVGHLFMGKLIAFTLIMRAKITYSRYEQASHHLSAMYKYTREIVQVACTYTLTDKSESAKRWRQNISYNAALLLRLTMAVLDFRSEEKAPWDIPELSEAQKREVKKTLMLKNSEEANLWAHSEDRKIRDESLRAPVQLAFHLQREILSHEIAHPLHHCLEELELLQCVSHYSHAFSRLKELMTTPFPFPLVQMSKTFLFFWVFTLPMVLCHDDYSTAVWSPYLIVLMTTFGFIGTDFVCTELDDPFGDDPSDLDNNGMAQLVFEDIYISIYKIDGEKWAWDLRKKINGYDSSERRIKLESYRLEKGF